MGLRADAAPRKLPVKVPRRGLMVSLRRSGLGLVTVTRLSFETESDGSIELARFPSESAKLAAPLVLSVKRSAWELWLPA